MPRKIPIIDFSRSYTFSNYFDLPFDTEDIVGEFGYFYERDYLKKPVHSFNLPRLGNLKERIENSLPYIGMGSEMARREFLIAPLLIDVVHYTRVQLKTEYFLAATEQLKGSLDYYFYTDNPLLIIEAKKADLDRGFTQLAVELIALDQWTDAESKVLTGAVSNGYTWQFGKLNRQEKTITQDVPLYNIPSDLELLTRILIEILRPDYSPSQDG